MQAPDPLDPSYPRGEQYGLMEFSSQMWRRRETVFLWGLLFAFLTAGYLLLFIKPYTAEALVRVDADTNITGGTFSKSPDINLDSEMDFIRSRSMFLQALNLLGPSADVTRARSTFKSTLLYQLGLSHPHLFSAAQPGLTIEALEVPERYLNQKLTLHIEADRHFTLRDAQGALLYDDRAPQANGVSMHLSTQASADQTYTLIPRSPDNVPRALQHQLQTQTLGRSAHSGFIRISFASDNADFSKRFLTALVDTYIKRAYDQSAQAKLQSAARLEAQLAGIKTDLEKAEADLKDFELAYGTIDMTSEMQLSLQQSVEVERQIRTLKAKQKELGAYYTSAHPMQISLADQLRFLEAEQQAKQRTIDRLPETQRRLFHYKREVETFKQMYTQTAEKLTQLRNEAASITGYAKVIDEPEILPGSGITRFVKNLLLSFIAGCCMGGLAVYADAFSPFATIRSVGQIAAITPLPILGTLKRMSPFEALMRTHTPRSSLPLIRSDSDANLFEDFLALMKNLAFASFGAPNPVLMIASQEASAAAEIVALNVASLYARLHKTLLIDCSMREPGLHSHLSLTSAPGLSDVLIGKAALDKALHILTPNLSFLPGGTVTSYALPLLQQPLFLDMLKEFAAHYGSVVLYCPALPETQAQSPLVNYVGTIAFVIGAGEKLERIRHFLAHFKPCTNVKGLILDNIR